MAFKRMAKYLAEVHLHMERLLNVLERIKIFYPLDVNKFGKLISKLENLLGKPVDVAVSKDKKRIIEKEALKGIRI